MTAISTPDPKARYAQAFEELERDELQSGREDSWLLALRRDAHEKFQALGFPTLRTEEWRQTNLAPLHALEGRIVPSVARTQSEVEPFLVPGLEALRMVFVNGHFAPELSNIGDVPDGVQVGSLRDAIENDSATVRAHLAQHAHFDRNAFIALNTAFMQDGAFVFVPRGVRMSTPLHLLFLTSPTDTPVVAHPRNLFVVEENADATIIEHYVGSRSDVAYFNNIVSEVVVGANARVDHYKVQQESVHAFHFAALQIEQARNANFSNLNVSFGGKLSRNQIGARLGEPGVETTLNGMLCIGGNSQVDNVTVMDHAAPNCNSHEVYTQVLDDQARANFSGKIFVRQVAQKTDAKQTSRSLLLSRDALSNSKPQLEIFADDVKCTHGATIGQISEDALFYLRARGVGEVEARAMLVLAFASAVTDQVRVEALREMLDAELFARLRGR